MPALFSAIPGIVDSADRELRKDSAAASTNPASLYAAVADNALLRDSNTALRNMSASLMQALTQHENATAAAEAKSNAPFARSATGRLFTTSNPEESHVYSSTAAPTA